MNNVVIGQQLHEKHSQMDLSYETKPPKKNGAWWKSQRQNKQLQPRKRSEGGEDAYVTVVQ